MALVTPSSSHLAWNRFFSRYGGDAFPPTKGIPRGPRKSKSARDLTAAEASSKKPSMTRSETDWDESMKKLRRLVLVEGIPGEEYRTPTFNTPARPLVWKLLLDVRTLDPALYLFLVAKGPSPMHDKIQNDAARTLATDQDFKGRVSEEALIRVLDAFVWRYWDGSSLSKEKKRETSFSYVQGMNVLLAPFLYVMPSELEAFQCFCYFIEYCCPTYVQPSLSGVHKGLKLLDKCLQKADPILYNHLKSKGLTAEIYGFASVMTLCAGTPPLHQLLQLWDYLLAFGTHLSILCIIAQLLLIRNELMTSPHPMKLLRQFPDLNAKRIIGVATTLIRDLKEPLYDELVQHMVEL